MFNQKNIQLIAAIGAFFVLNFCITDTARALMITDMAGCTVNLPDSIRKVYAPSPYGSYLMYSIDPVWQNVKAVRQGHVYLIPRHPFNWFDRPPSFMRIMGLKWLANILYPAEYKTDIVKEAKDFYRLFLGVDLSDDEMRQVIYP